MNGYEEIAEAQKWAETYANRMRYPVVVVAWPNWRSVTYTGRLRSWWTRRPRMISLWFVVALMLAYDAGILLTNAAAPAAHAAQVEGDKSRDEHPSPTLEQRGGTGT